MKDCVTGWATAIASTQWTGDGIEPRVGRSIGGGEGGGGGGVGGRGGERKRG